MYKDIIASVSSFLDQDVPISEAELEEALRASEKLRLPLLQARTKAQIEFLRKRAQYLHPKERDLTNLDREIMLDAHTTSDRETMELLMGLEQLLKDRRATLSLLLDI